MTRIGLLSLAVGTIALATITGLVALRQDDDLNPRAEGLRRVQLPPLPDGEPSLPIGRASMQIVDVRDLRAESTVVFVGTVIDKGGSQQVAPPAPEGDDPALSAHSIRFAVTNVFRGPRVDTIDVATLDLEELDPFDVGRTYVVFAKSTTLGTESLERLVPTGYWQGSFIVEGGIGKNRRGDVVNASDPLR